MGANCANLPEFEERVTMYVYEEMIDGKKLTEIINTTHENVKYLPGHKLPPNVVSLQGSFQFLWKNFFLSYQQHSFFSRQFMLLVRLKNKIA